MNNYLYVLQLYLWRPRFWVLAVGYLLFVVLPFVDARDTTAATKYQSYISAAYLCVVGCFLGLHVRRQFANAAAYLLPGYAVPHLVVAGVLLNLLWCGVPALAVAAGTWPPGILSIHAVAALFAAVLACWPRSLLLTALVPVLLIWGNRPLIAGGQPPLEQLVNGDRPVIAGMMIAGAVAAQIAAAMILLRLPRTGITASDELTIDATAGSQDTNFVNQWLLQARDAAADRHLHAVNWSPIQRWRVPTAISPAHLAIAPMLIALFTGIGWLAGDWQIWMALSMQVTCGILLIVPLSAWHVRRRIMAVELMRPVSRERYFREVLLSLAYDMAVWMSVGLAVLIFAAVVEFGFVLGWKNNWDRLLVFSSLGFVTLLCLATFVFGVAVSTMRWPMWLPIVALVTYIGLPLLAVCVLAIVEAPRKNTFPQFITLFLASCAGTGLLLSYTTYRRWLRSDVP